MAVERFLHEDISPSKLEVAAAVLESAMRYSPHNGHLKIAAMQVYAQLNATARSYELFQSIFLKHIQYESCSYLVLPLLQSGGLYLETITVCKEIIRLQRVASHDAGDYSYKSMELGSFSKADEILRFHRERMNKSLTTLEAKGLILNAAPLYVQTEKLGNVGVMHGIVGGSDDFERAKNMTAEAHDPFAAFSILGLHGKAADAAKNFSENRDFEIIPEGDCLRPSFASPEGIAGDSIRRGHVHGILIRTALCIDMTKGPKKGKVVSISPDLKKRCTSMLTAVTQARVDSHEFEGPPGCAPLMKALFDQCRLIAAVGAGFVTKSELLQEDSLEAREECAISIIAQILSNLKDAQVEISILSLDQVSFLLSECIVPVFAAFQMCAEIFDLFGWGRRKRKTKRCAAGLADIAILLSSMLGDMSILSPQRLPNTFESAEYQMVLSTGLVEASIVSGTREIVSRARNVTLYRLTNILSEVKEKFDAFDIQE
jgi:hypothetical protein